MEAREDKAFFLFLDDLILLRVVDLLGDPLDVQVVLKQIQQRLFLPEVFPQIRRLVAAGVDGVLGVFVEGE